VKGVPGGPRFGEEINLFFSDSSDIWPVGHSIPTELHRLVVVKDKNLSLHQDCGKYRLANKFSHLSLNSGVKIRPLKDGTN
jgi:hypothetical protein